MTNDSDKHVFISYVREDSEQVDRLCDALERAGIPYWRDRNSLGPGDRWKRKIQEAIQSGSLVFLACFSTASVTRGKSYMNEELTIAVEEYRLRAPDRPWLVPVRLDDVEIPHRDLGAGASIGDINRSDLFGDDYGSNLVTLIEMLRGLLGVQDRHAVDARSAIDSADAADLPEQLQSLTKELLLDPSRRIELDDVINKETRRVLAALADPEQFPVNGSSGSRDELLVEAVEQAQQMWRLVEPLCWSMAVAAKYAEPNTLAPWASALRSLTSFGEKPEGGRAVFIELRKLPALCLAEAAAVACVSSRRWDNLHALLVEPKIATNAMRGKESLVAVIKPYRAFETADVIPNVLTAISRDSELDVSTALAEYGQGRGRFYTPVSDWIYTMSRPAFEGTFPDENDYADAFDLAECYLGMLQQHHAIEWSKANDTGYVGNSSWYGRSIWRDRHSDRTLVDEVLESATSSGGGWPQVRAGLFNSDPAGAVAAIEKYRENYNQVRRQRTF